MGRSVISWVDTSQINPGVLIIGYEDIRAAPQAGLSKLCRHLNVDADDQQIAAAIERNQISMMRNKEPESVTVKDGATNSTPFSGSGKVGEWGNTFSPQQIESFTTRSKAALEILSYAT